MKPHKRHRLLGFLATMFALACPCRRCRPRAACRFTGTAICADCGIGSAMVHACLAIALLLAIVSRRILAALIAIAAIACNGYWQYPFFYSTDPLPKPRRTPWPQPPQHQRCLRARHDLQCIWGRPTRKPSSSWFAISASKCFCCRRPPRISSKLNEAGIEHYLAVCAGLIV